MIMKNEGLLFTSEGSEIFAQERLRGRLEEFLSELTPVDGHEQIFRLKYEVKDLFVFPDFVREFLTDHVESQGRLLAYVTKDDKNISFGLRDEKARTNFSLTLAPQAPLYHPVGFWGVYTKARYEWQHKNRAIIERTSRFIQSDYPRPISEREASLMLITAKFIRDHIDQSAV